MDGLRERLNETVIPHAQRYPLHAILITTIILFITTRLFTGSSSSSRKDGSSTPPLAPFWVPLFGHAPRIFISPISALARFRNRYSQGVFSIRLFQSSHSFVFRPSLAASLLEQPESIANKEYVARRIMVTNFGLSKKDLAAYDEAAAEVHQVTKEYLSGSRLDDLSKATLRDLDDNAADAISFNGYPTDQMEWERHANAELLEDKEEKTMALDFFELMKTFIARTATISVFGTDFVEVYPDIWPHLWVFNDAFHSLAMGVPLWAPFPSSQRARIALSRLRTFMREYHDELDKFLSGEEPGMKWQDFHTISPLVRARTEVYRKHGLSSDVRAAFDVALLWSTSVNSTSLISWSLFELYQDRVLLSQIREQITPFVEIVLPRNEFGGAVWIPPQIKKLDLEGLLTECPLLQAVYLETLRLYGGGWSARYLKEDVILKDNEEGFVLKKGTFAHVVNDLHHSDPRSFTDSKVWQVGRYLEETVNKKGAKAQQINPYTVRASDGSLTMCDDAAFTQRKVLMYISVFISLYDLEPAGSEQWPSPSVVKGVTSAQPWRPVRLWATRRVPPQAE
ncbi:cytochrome P450 monooxygenase 7B1 [Fusarium heterosporum]|uniref:Cytochrome P450 monooxygenase 7B1 n=1 Tax=Fusarium heterosporum TaxID=42747 RepID=A0A8H5T901_FUSHE|nr:cytochrome P450 monooxygenase 7B1 [Fusarium heterosporum]